MKIKILKTGKVEEYEDSYAVRLIEQGQAIPAPHLTIEKGKPPKESGAN